MTTYIVCIIFCFRQFFVKWIHWSKIFREKWRIFDNFLDYSGCNTFIQQAGGFVETNKIRKKWRHLSSTLFISRLPHSTKKWKTKNHAQTDHSRCWGYIVRWRNHGLGRCSIRRTRSDFLAVAGCAQRNECTLGANMRSAVGRMEVWHAPRGPGNPVLSAILNGNCWN